MQGKTRSKVSLLSSFPFSPVSLLILSVFPALAALFISPTKFGRPLTYAEFTAREFVIVAALTLSVYVGYKVSFNQSKASPIKYKVDLQGERDQHRVILSYTRVCLLIGTLAHIILFANAFLKSRLFLAGSGWLPSIPIITTLCHLLNLGLLLALVLKLRYPNRKNVTRFSISISVLAIVSRAMLNNERLSILSIVVSLITYLLFTYQYKWNKKIFIIFLTSMFIGIVYAIAEYFRSWQTYRRFTDQNFIFFTFERVVNYYLTAQSNGAVYLNDFAQQYWFPLIILTPIAIFPYFGQLLVNVIPGPQDWFFTLIKTSGTAEYTNINAILVVAGDLSFLGSLPFLYFCGKYLGKLYARAVSNDIESQVLYSSFVIVLIELPRVFLLTAPRMLPVYLMLFLFVRSLRRISDSKNYQ